MKKLLLLIIILSPLSYAFISTDFMRKDSGNQFFYKGVCFTAPPQPIDSNTFNPIIELGANAIAIIPYAFGNPEEHYLKFNHPNQWWGEREEGIIYSINQSHENDLKVLLKPHIWFGGGLFNGDYQADSEENWRNIESDYTSYMLFYAKLAEEYNVEALCIGTELKKWVQIRPEFWKNLILEIKEIYSGKLTYAANWDNYQNIAFWADLDLIGVDAYFPLSDKKQPTINELIEGWKIHYQELKKTSVHYNKPIIFAEFGYRSIDFNAKEPWDSQRKPGVNLKNQETAYQALFDVFSNDEWFAGGFLWKWHSKHSNAGGVNNNRFTPQNKPGEHAIRKLYKELN